MDGFDFPTGTLAERAGQAVPPGLWNIGLAYGRYYLLSGKFPAIHTGLDIALEPYGGYGEPVYATADGEVTFSRDVTGTTWRNLIVLRHTLADGSLLCSRYAHLKIRLVKVGDVVTRGQPIGEVGNADGAFAPHLHFDLAPGDTLTSKPTNWPGDDIAAVRRLYIDPLAYIRGHRPMGIDRIIALAKQIEIEAASLQSAPTPPPVTTPMFVIDDGVRGRLGPGLNYDILKLFKSGDEVGVIDEANGWKHAATPIDCYISSQYLSASRPT